MHDRNTPLIYTVGFDPMVSSLFLNNGYLEASRLEEADVVIFTGGADINPFLYGQPRHPSTVCDYTRDMEDIKALRKCESHQSLIGICRGAQFLNVMVGNGSLYQNINGHLAHHLVRDIGPSTMQRVNPIEFTVTSTHHQEMIPGTGAIKLLDARMASHKYEYKDAPVRVAKLTDRFEPDYVADNEALMYDETPFNGVLCVQGHPEYGAATADFKNWFFSSIDHFLLTEDQTTACMNNIMSE